MKVLVTGATGFVGRHLGRELVKCGHEVVVVSRNPGRAECGLGFTQAAVSWGELEGEASSGVLSGIDAVVHLAGDSVAARWTEEKKARILASRVETTRALVRAMERGVLKPKVFVSASAVGIYGDRGEEILKEEKVLEGRGAARDFLASVCEAWEAEVFRAESFGVRCVALRFGMVLGPDGGALAKMLPVFRWGLGGRIGSGRQWMSWIHVGDLAGMVRFALEAAGVRGPYNAVSPRAVRNKEFTRVLGRVLGRPVVARVPKLALRLAFGEMSSMLLGSQRADAGKIMRAGFVFQHPDLEGALRDLLCFVS